MNLGRLPRWFGSAARVLLSAVGLGAPAAWAWSAAEEGMLNLDQGRCEAAAEAFNRGLREGDPTAHLMVGFMYLKGACLKAVPEKAAPYLEAAAKAGESDAARLLVLMHGFGIGVAQSYAQAGRWFVAQTDILRLNRPQAAGAVDPGANVSVEALQHLGVLASVQAALPDRLRHPIGRLSANRPVETMDVKVLLTLGPNGLEWALARTEADRSLEARSVNRRSSDAPQMKELDAAISGIVRDLPPHPRPAEPVPVVVPIAFRVR